MFSCLFGKSIKLSDVERKPLNQLSRKEMIVLMKDVLQNRNVENLKAIIASGWKLDQLPSPYISPICYEEYFLEVFLKHDNKDDYFTNFIFRSRVNIDFGYYTSRNPNALFHESILRNHQHNIKMLMKNSRTILITPESLITYLKDVEISSAEVHQAHAGLDFCARKNVICSELIPKLREIIDSKIQSNRVSLRV